MFLKLILYSLEWDPKGSEIGEQITYYYLNNLK
jgi:hypothetical protein